MTFAKYPVSGGGGSGSVVGPVSSVNNGVVLFDGASGALIKDLGVGAANQVLRTDGTTPSFGPITNAFVDASAGIAYSKLAALAFNRALVSNGTGAVIVSAVTADELGFVAGVTSAIQTQINARALDSAVVHLTGAETINGVKTFGSTIVGSVDGNAGTVTNGVYLTGAQTITGAKTFSAATTAITIDAGASSSQRILFTGSGTNPDLFLAFQKTGPGAQSWDFGMNAGAISSDAFGLWNPTSSTVGVTFDPATSAMSLYDTLTIQRTTNQIVLGVTNTTTITSTAPAASRVYTIADAGGAASFVMTAGAQTIGGAKTFSTAVIINPTTNQIVLGTTNTTTITSTAPSASRVYTIDDAGGAASFVMTAGAQTIAGIKTFSTGLAISGGSSANNTIYLQTNVFSIRGGTSGFSIRSTADGANLEVSDAGAVTIGPLTGTPNIAHVLRSGTTAIASFGHNAITLSQPTTINGSTLNGTHTLDGTMTLNGTITVGSAGTVSTGSNVFVMNHNANAAFGVVASVRTFTGATADGPRLNWFRAEGSINWTAGTGNAGQDSDWGVYANGSDTGEGTRVVRVNSTGAVTIGPPSGLTGAHVIRNTSTTSQTLAVRNSDTSTSSDAQYSITCEKGSTTVSTSQNYILFSANNGASLNGKINGNGANNATFGATSDSRVKKNVADMEPMLASMVALRPVTFDYLKTASTSAGEGIGFIAQEMEVIFPDAVSKDGNGFKQISGWDKTTARLVKALQELSAKNDALEARLLAAGIA